MLRARAWDAPRWSRAGSASASPVLQHDRPARAEPQALAFELRGAGVEQRAPAPRRQADFGRLLVERGGHHQWPAPHEEDLALRGGAHSLARVVLQGGMVAPEREQRLVPAQGGGVLAPAVDAAPPERLLVVRVWHVGPGEALELLAPSLADGLHQRGIAVRDEVLERLARAPFLALEIERQRRLQRQHRRGGAHPALVRQRGQPFALRAIADLIVVLRADDEVPRAQVRRGRAVLAPERRLVLALVEPAALDGRHHLRHRILEILVVPLRLA